MKKLVALLILALAGTGYAAGVAKTVCHTTVSKAGKSVQTCKKIKVHKKLNGVKVPVKK